MNQNRLQELFLSDASQPKQTCDVCGSENIIEAPSIGVNCNSCHPL